MNLHIKNAASMFLIMSDYWSLCFVAATNHLYSLFFSRTHKKFSLVCLLQRHPIAISASGHGLDGAASIGRTMQNERLSQCPTKAAIAKRINR